MKFKYNLRKKLLFTISIFLIYTSFGQNSTTFKTSGGKQTTGYKACISWYKKLAATYDKVKLYKPDTKDSGLPIHVLLFSAEKGLEPTKFHQQNKVIIFVNNGIHPC